MERNLKNGDHVIYLDERREAHDALATNVWYGYVQEDGKSRAYSYDEHVRLLGQPPCVNLVFVLSDERMRDQYGQQTRHEGSVTHGDAQSPKRLGRCWLFPDEV